MPRAILGKKIGMTQIFDDSGCAVPVTIVEAGPCVVVQKRKPAKQGYSAIQLGFGETKRHRLNKPEQGVFEKRDLKPYRHLREVRMPTEEIDKYQIGDIIKVDIFNHEDVVDVIGITKGRGFQGVVKRYGFRGSPKTHGTHESRRHPGSIGNCEFPGRVFKGRKLPGHMGNKRVTTQNVKLVKIDIERNLLLIRGSVPGANNGFVMVHRAIKRAS